MDMQQLHAIYSSLHPPLRCALCQIPQRRCKHERDHEGLELAHLFSRGRNGKAANTHDNVLWLCSTCHRAHHSSSVINGPDGRSWPNVTTSDLCHAKKDLGEFYSMSLAAVTGYTTGYIEDLAQTPYPAMIRQEREKWSSGVDNLIQTAQTED